MLIEELVTPRSVAPVALPLPHGDSSVPNFEAWVVDVVLPPPLPVFVASGLVPRPPPLLHEETAMTAATAIPNTPSERLLFTTPPVDDTKRPHSSVCGGEQDRRPGKLLSYNKHQMRLPGVRLCKTPSSGASRGR